MATRRRPRPMVMKPFSTPGSRNVRGAVAWKLLLGIAIGIGAVWVLSQPAVTPQEPEPASRAAGGAIAVRTPVPDTQSPPAQLQHPPVAVVQTNDTQNDPFAGVDVTNNSVLRHIAGIEEKTRARHAPVREATRAAPVAPQPQPRPQPQLQVTRQVPTRLALDESVPEQKSAPSPAPTHVVAPPPPAVEVVRTASVALPPAPVPEQPATRLLADSPAITPPARNEGATSGTAAAGASNERVLVAALGKTAPPPQSAVAPLKVANRTIPIFPAEAIRAGIQSGRVVARLTIEADGRVSAAQIVSSTPMGYFERESRRALATWRYEPPGQATSTDVELLFNREQ
jgi:periplasmic protein TonB